MRKYFVLISLLFVFACKENPKPTPSVLDQPNIILIIADDMNWDDCGSYGHPFIKTPNIDKLASEGMRFDHAYVTASSCSPSRASMIMGRYPHNTGAEQLHWSIPAGSFTFVQQLKAAGYFTAAAGKWHMGDHIRDHFDVINEANTAGFVLPDNTGQAPPKMIAQQPSGCEDWVSTLQSRPKDRPFFMWFAALDPHRAYEIGILDRPHGIADVVVPPYLPDVADVREDLRQYYDEIGRLDVYVGQVMAEVEKQNIEENTVIIFISDNGRPFPRDKTSLYEGGIKTPFIVKWPGHVMSGSVSKSLVSTVDLAPTIMEIASISPPPNILEGISFAPILQNPTVETRTHVFAEDHWHDYEDHGRSVSNRNWKLIRNDYPDLPSTPSADAGRSLTFRAMQRLKENNKLTVAQMACFQKPRPLYELYDLENDPYEINNLVQDSRHANIRDELIRVLDAWSIETSDFLPSRRTPDEFDRLTGEPDHTVRRRPRPDKKAMFGTYGKY